MSAINWERVGGRGVGKHTPFRISRSRERAMQGTERILLVKED